MILDAITCANLCAELYATNASAWTHYFERDQVIIAHRVIDGIDTFICRGSKVGIDWARDSLAVPAHHPVLGWVHAGFAIGIDEAAAEVASAATGKIALIGHSLGAARAMLLAGLFAKAGTPALQVTVFGCPRPGGEELRDTVCLSGTHPESYRNERDPVTYVPFAPGIFCHVIEPAQVHGGAEPGDLTIFREHHIARYIAGLQATYGAV
jgi:hypothetical protein